MGPTHQLQLAASSVLLLKPTRSSIPSLQVQVLEKEKAKVVSKLEEKDSLYLKTKQTLRQTEDKFRWALSKGLGEN